LKTKYRNLANFKPPFFFGSTPHFWQLKKKKSKINYFFNYFIFKINFLVLPLKEKQAACDPSARVRSAEPFPPTRTRWRFARFASVAAHGHKSEEAAQSLTRDAANLPEAR
jgi:hypothetical protein